MRELEPIFGPYLPECSYCWEEIRPIEAGGKGDLGEDESGNDYCDRDCRDSAGERAEMRANEDYYGGSGPLSITEQCQRAWDLKHGKES